VGQAPITLIPVTNVVECAGWLPQFFGKCPVLPLPVRRRMVNLILCKASADRFPIGGTPLSGNSAP
jgi:hypothetical protein